MIECGVRIIFCPLPSIIDSTLEDHLQTETFISFVSWSPCGHLSCARIVSDAWMEFWDSNIQTWSLHPEYSRSSRSFTNGESRAVGRMLFPWLMCSTALRCWTFTTPQCSPTGSAATTHCCDTAASLTPQFGFLTCICSVKFRMWESGSACTPGSVPKTSSFLWKVKQIWLANDNHMPAVVQAHGKGRRRVDMKPCCSSQSSCSCERVRNTTPVMCV